MVCLAGWRNQKKNEGLCFKMSHYFILLHLNSVSGIQQDGIIYMYETPSGS